MVRELRALLVSKFYNTNAKQTCARWASIMDKAGTKQEVSLPTVATVARAAGSWDGDRFRLVVCSQTALRTKLKVLATESVSERDSATVVDFKPNKVFGADSDLGEFGLHSYLQFVSRCHPSRHPSRPSRHAPLVPTLAPTLAPALAPGMRLIN